LAHNIGFQKTSRNVKKIDVNTKTQLNINLTFAYIQSIIKLFKAD